MPFDPASVSEFRYLRWSFDGTLATFDYALGDERFTETVEFTPGQTSPRVERVLALLGGVLGLSYYKAAAPDRFVIEADGLTSQAVDYLRLATREGLAEFAYRAGLPGKLEPQFAADPVYSLDMLETPSGRPLVPIGGGKDSVVSVESLVAAGLDPVQFAVNPNVVIRRVAEASGRELVTAKRTIDRRLLELNADGALNGHVPVTAMNSLIAIAQSLLLGLGPVVMSNESSAPSRMRPG